MTFNIPPEIIDVNLFIVGTYFDCRNNNESMVSLVLRQYMRGENATESLVVFFFCLAYSNRKTKCQNYRKISRNVKM